MAMRASQGGNYPPVNPYGAPSYQPGPGYAAAYPQYGTGYQPMQPMQPMQTGAPTVPIIQPMANAPAQAAPYPGILWVDSEADLDELTPQPNRPIAAWDKNANVIYVLSLDATGKPQRDYYDYTKRASAAEMRFDPSAYVPRADFETLVRAVSDLRRQLGVDDHAEQRV